MAEERLPAPVRAEPRRAEALPWRHGSLAIFFTLAAHLALLGTLARWRLPWPPLPQTLSLRARWSWSEPPPPVAFTAAAVPARPPDPEAARRLDRQARSGVRQSRRRLPLPSPSEPPPAVRAASKARSERAVATPQTASRAALRAARTPSATTSRVAAGQAVAGAASDAGLSQAVGQCTVLLLDNSAQGDDARRLKSELMGRLQRLAADEFFYIIAYDDVSHRMFSLFSPESQPAVCTSANLQRAQLWLDGLRTGNSTDAAPLAVTHALQLRPAAVQIFSSGKWQPAASSYLRSINVGPGGQVGAAVHVVAVPGPADHLLVQVAPRK